MIRKTYFILNRLLISLNPFCLNACINSFTCLRASIYKSIWNTITASIVAFSVNVNIRMYNFDDVQCTVIPSVAYGFVTGMNLQLC